MIDLTPEQRELILRILQERAPNLCVRAFGSRVTGHATPRSDLDLTLDSGEAMDWRALEALKDAFAESDLPFLVDLVDWHRLDPGFRRVVEEACETLQRGDEGRPTPP
jgi:uncharacterized protein